MKIVISVPDTVFRAGEHLARQLGISRNQLYTNALAQYLGACRAKAVTARLDRIYSAERCEMEPELLRAQVDTLAAEAW